jgi:hypothetical protein
MKKKGGNIKKMQEGDKMGNGKPLKSNFKKTTYINESSRLQAKGDSLKAAYATAKGLKRNRIMGEMSKNESAMKDLEASKKKK